MAGHAHDDAGAVAHEDVIGHEQGQGLVGHGVHGLDALQAHAGLFLVQFAPLKVGLVGGFLLIGSHGVPVLDLGLPALQQGMLRGDDHIGGAEQGIGPGGVHGDPVTDIGIEGNLRAGGPADPVALLDLHPLDIVHILQVVQQALGIGGNLQHPLALFLADDLAAAALANAVDHLLIGQHALAAGTPVHGHGGLVGQALLEHLQKDPLGPLIVVGVRGVYHPVPVKAVAQHFQLAGEVGDILPGDNGRMDVILDGVVLRGQAEGVKADGEQDVIALHALFAGDDVHGGKGPGMAHMQALAGGIGELDEPIKLGALVPGNGGIGLGLLPPLLPLFLNGGKIVLHAVFSFL